MPLVQSSLSSASINGTDLNIEQSRSVDLDAHGMLDEVSELLLVGVLDILPLLLEGRVIDVLEQALELGQILEPQGLVTPKSLGDEDREAGVALIEPSARSDTIGDVAEPSGTLSILARAARGNQ